MAMAVADGDDVTVAYLVDTDALQPRYRRNEVLVLGTVVDATQGDDVLVTCRSGDILVRQYLFRIGDIVTLADLADHRQATMRDGGN